MFRARSSDIAAAKGAGQPAVQSGQAPDQQAQDHRDQASGHDEDVINNSSDDSSGIGAEFIGMSEVNLTAEEDRLNAKIAVKQRRISNIEKRSNAQRPPSARSRS